MLNELDLLSCEAIDKDSIDNNLDKLVEWFKETSRSKMEQSFLNELPTKLASLFLNMNEQIEELDYNAASKLKLMLKRISEVDLLSAEYNIFDKNNKLSEKLENRFKYLVSNLRDQSKKIKKQKNLEKRKKLYEAEKQDRMQEIDSTNNMLTEDDVQIKDEQSVKKSNAISFTKDEN